MLDFQSASGKYSGFKNLFLMLKEKLRRGDDITRYL
jgi:hypothetical protein